ncbi:MAG: NAD+ synthase [Spirochaetaceae bacterium]|nr:NAD+ synthase [Spirochaetaceae bacterium]
MKIAVAQINSKIGDFAGNMAKITGYTEEAQRAGCELVLFPELAVCGYPPMDLLDQKSFVDANESALQTLSQKIPAGLACAVGSVARNKLGQGKELTNAYSVLMDGAIQFTQVKTLLPTYDVFDEARNFEPARSWEPFVLHGIRIGFAICEDLWRETEMPGVKYAENPVQRLLEQGIDILAAPSASPYYMYKHAERLSLADSVVRQGGLTLIYINAVGANDSIIFDGRSFVCGADGVLQPAKAMEEDLLIFEYKGNVENEGERIHTSGWGGQHGATSDVPAPPVSSRTVQQNVAVLSKRPSSATPAQHPASELDMLESALVLGLRDYMAKCGFVRCHLGLSGGIDSALVACLAVTAVGAGNVAAFSMPSRFSSDGSKDDARALAANLGLRYQTLPIEPVFTAFLATLEGVFEGRPFDIAEENVQARIRGSLLMAYSNKFNSMLLTTGNKSELAMGYCTLYGDMNGALGPIGDLFKTDVFALCRRINEKSRQSSGVDLIPQEILDKPPSAELRPNQKDQDSLPPYEVLDEILKLYLFQNLDAAEIAKRGIDRALASDVIKTAARAEFKRRQAPPVLKVSPRAFGMGRRLPIARALQEL